jgi:glycogen debranching enzyme
MEEAVGYPEIACAHQTLIEESLVIKHDRLFLLMDQRGDIVPPGNCGLGLFEEDTRMLSHYALLFFDEPAQLLSSRATSAFSIRVDLAIPDDRFGGDRWDPKNSVHISREIVLGDRLAERVVLVNYLARPVEFQMELRVGCDFADIFEVRGWKRERRGHFFAPAAGASALQFAYEGTDGKRIRSTLRFAEPPDECVAGRIRWLCRLEPNDPRILEWQLVPDRTLDQEDGAGGPGGDGSSPVRPGRMIDREPMRKIYSAWRRECTSWSTDVVEFNHSLGQARDDLRGLHVAIDGEEVIAAGIPWYSTVFGRDSIITALQALVLTPGIARRTLRYLARHQGSEVNPHTEEQPGKIMHELRRGELARSGEIPHVPYFGTVDATPLWLILLHETWRWTGDEALARELLPHAERALDWIEEYGDVDGDGFVEYHRVAEKGLWNQGWKDSGDGVPFPDGRLAEPPIALVEVQGYVHDAKVRMAQLFRELGNEARSVQLRAEAETLRERIIEHFWMEEAGTFALALDGGKNKVPTATSNAAHLLWSRVPTPAQSARLADHLLSEDMFSGWGIRTLARNQRVFNPMSYHNGSVWPHDNAIAAFGLSLAGHTGHMLPILASMHDLAASMDSHRLPELVCGMKRGRGGPVHYPVSCSPQAWASGAFFMLLHAATGILPDAPAGYLHIRQPRLPPFLRELTLSRLKVGKSRVSVEFSREGDRTVVKLLEVHGDPLHVAIEL